MEIRRDKGWGYKKIAKELQRRYAVLVPKSTVYFWISRRSNPIGHWNVFDLVASKELAYVIGVKMGDGFRTTYKPQYQEDIRLMVRDKDFAEHFNLTVAKVLGKERPNKIRVVRRKDKDGAVYFHARYGSIQLGQILDRDLRGLRQFIEAHPAHFLRGFFDSEGSASANLANERLQIRVFASNTNIDNLYYVQGLLRDKFDIVSHIYRDKEAGYANLVHGEKVTKNMTSYLLRIDRRESVARFLRFVGFSITRKQDILRDGLHLIEKHGSRLASKHWKLLYMKMGRRWIRKAS